MTCRLKALTMIEHLHGHDLKFKHEWASASLKLMSVFCEKLYSLTNLYNMSILTFNPGGSAVAGEAHLMCMVSSGLGVHIFTSSIFPTITFRSIKHLQDYQGGQNHQLQAKFIRQNGILRTCDVMLRAIGYNDEY